MHKNFKLVANITGGGLGFFDKLTNEGGASSFFLEGNIPYNQQSFDELIGGKPDKYVSQDAAIQLADAAYRRCAELHPNKEECSGLGVTAKLNKKEEQREDRENVGYIAYRTKHILYTSACYLNNTLKRFNQELILAKTCIGLLNGNYLDSVYPVPSLFINAEDDKIDNLISDNLAYFNIFPGSFNPFHKGHLELCERAYEFNKKKVILELSIKHYNKPPISSKSAYDRVDSIHKLASAECIGGVVFTKRPRYVDKIKLFGNGHTYIMGSDVWNECLKDEQFLDTVSDTSSEIILFPRKNHTPDCRSLFSNIAQIHFIKDYKDSGISSTEIRHNESV